jgi:hypothetical protein
MDAARRPINHFLAALCLSAVAVLAFYGYLDTAATTSDDLVYERAVVDGRLGAFCAELARGSGRFHHYLHVGLTSLPYFCDSLPARKALALIPFLAAIASLAFVAARLSGLPALGFLTALLCLGLYQDNWHHNILSSYPLVFDSGMLCIIWAGYCLWRHGGSGRTSWLVAANLLAFAAYCHFEAFVCYIPVLCGIVWLSGPGGPGRRLRTMLAANAAFPIWAILYLGYRLLHPSEYAGNTLDLSSPLRILETVVAYSRSALPLGAFPLNIEYANRFPTITRSPVLTFGQYLAGMIANWPQIAPAWLALGLLAGGLTGHLLQRVTPRPRLRPLAVLLAAYAVFCPNFLIALSPKYQEPAVRGLNWYVTSTFSFYAQAVALALAGLWLAGRLGDRPRARRTLAAGLGLVAGALTLVNASVNASVLESKVAAASRWRVAGLLAKSPALAHVPEGGLIVAPDLFAPVNVELTGPGYWDAWLTRRTGRHVRIVEAVDPADPPETPFYALRRLSGQTDRTTAIALARVARLGPPNADPYAKRPQSPALLADQVAIVSDAPNRFFDVLYQEGDHWRQVPAHAVGRRGLAETAIAGRDIAVAALALAPAGSVSAYVAAPLRLRFGEGFSAPERAITGDIVWAGNQGELILENSGEKTAAARLDCMLIALAPVRLTASAPGIAATLVSDGLSTPQHLDITLPPGHSRLVLRAEPSVADPGKRFGILGAAVSPE